MRLGTFGHVFPSMDPLAMATQVGGPERFERKGEFKFESSFRLAKREKFSNESFQL